MIDHGKNLVRSLFVLVFFFFQDIRDPRSGASCSEASSCCATSLTAWTANSH